MMGTKGHPQSTGSGGNGGGGGGGSGGWMMKNKMAMVAVLILAGIVGVMVVQKVRDRRFFNLVIKDKDRQILSLNLLLQKERQYAKENKRKNQDLNAKLYSLRTQKIELVNKIMEMKSTIGSMRDEQWVLELAIDEKQNEIKRKESEIIDLKSSFQTPPRIWSLTCNEVNLTSKIPTTKVKVQKANEEDSEKLASSKGYNNNNNNAKTEMLNTTNGGLATEEMMNSEGNGLSSAMKGRRFFIGSTESQRYKSNGQNEKSQLKLEEGSTDIIQYKSNRTKGEAERVDEDDTITSNKGSKENQEYKKEREE